jgi:hypothetical protein
MRALLSAGLCIVVVCGVANPVCLADDNDDVKKAIGAQLELLKAGKADGLQSHLTRRLSDMITPEAVDKGKKEAGKHTLDDLVASVEIYERGKMKTAKIKMKSGRTLTTLVHTDGKWLADTLWFK